MPRPNRQAERREEILDAAIALIERHDLATLRLEVAADHVAITVDRDLPGKRHERRASRDPCDVRVGSSRRCQPVGVEDLDVCHRASMASIGW